MVTICRRSAEVGALAKCLMLCQTPPQTDKFDVAQQLLLRLQNSFDLS
jgi:hypothetical protein